MTSATPTFDRFIALQATGLFTSYLHTASAETYAADFKKVQAEMASIHTSRREEAVRFRRDIAEIAVAIRRSVQMGLASTMQTKLMIRLHGAATKECDVVQKIDELEERIRNAGVRVGELGPRNTKGEKGMVALMGLFVEVSSLQAEKEKLEGTLGSVVAKRVGIEKEVEGSGGCQCQAKMCAKCMELLRQCEECEQVGKAWQKASKK